MSTINEQIVTGRAHRVLIDKAAKLWQRISFWTKASDVEFNDKKTAETKVGAIDGITDSLASTSSRIAASAKSVNKLSNDLGGLSFAQDAEGNWGYKPSGADTVIPFKSGNAIYLGIGNTFDIKTIYPNWNDLTVNNFIVGCNYITGITQSNRASGRLEYGLSMSKTYKNGILTLGNFSKTQTDDSGQLIGVLNFANSFALLLLPT